jgi:hypothetical protein
MAMETLREQSKLHLARTVGFYLSVLVFVFFWLLAFNFVLYASFIGWFDPVLSDTIHFVHDISLATWIWVWGLAMVVQLYRPAKRVTAMQIALILTLTDMVPGLVKAALGTAPFDPSVMLFFGPVFIAAALHPARGELFRPGAFDWKNVNPVLLGLAVLAVVPVGLYVLGQWHFQDVLTDEHAALGHYGTMVYYGLSLIALATLASLGSRGRRPAAYAAALMAAMLGIASMFNPTMSALDGTWSALAILWGVAVIVAYEWSTRRVAAGLSVSPTEKSKASP